MCMDAFNNGNKRAVEALYINAEELLAAERKAGHNEIKTHNTKEIQTKFQLTHIFQIKQFFIMKARFFAIAAMAAMVGFTACNKDGESGQNPADGSPAKVTVNLETATRSTSMSAPLATDDTNINNYTVFFFNNLGVLKNRLNGTTTGQEFTTTNDVTEIYVVANAGTGTTAVPATVKSKTALEGWIGDLASNGSQVSARWATGKSSVTFDASNEARPTVTMTFVSARITLKLETMADYTNTPVNPKSLIINNVYLLNAGGTTKLFAAAGSMKPSVAELSAWNTANTTTYKPLYAGRSMVATPPFAYVPANYGVYAGLNEAVGAGMAKATLDATYFLFYSFENKGATAADFPTILAIEGTYDSKPVYYSVHLNTAQQFTTATGSLTDGVKRGNSYDLSIKLTGKAKFEDGGDWPGETGGDEDPTDDPVATGKVTVALSINPWTPQAFYKEF